MTYYTKGFQKARNKLETFYDGVCKVIQYESLPGTIQAFQEITVGENIPCHLDYETVQVVNATDQAAAIVQRATLFLAPEIKILPGSKIVVEQNQSQTTFKASGKPAIYQTHQEIPLEIAEKWA